MLYFDRIIKLLDVSRVSFDDDEEAEYFLQWFNNIVQQHGEGWIKDNRYLVMNQWEIEREDRNEEIQKEIERKARMEQERLMVNQYIVGQMKRAAPRGQQRDQRNLFRQIVDRLKRRKNS